MQLDHGKMMEESRGLMREIRGCFERRVGECSETISPTLGDMISNRYFFR
jgi:hypothetical protein